MKRTINNDSSSTKKIKVESTTDNDECTIISTKYEAIIKVIKKWYNRYKLINSTNFIGLPFKSIPLQYLIVQDHYFFDIRELYNISLNVNRLCNPYTKQPLHINNKRYIYNIYIRHRNDLKEYRKAELYNINENISNLIAKISCKMNQNNIIFNNTKLLKMNTITLLELFDDIHEYECMGMFLSDYQEDIYKLNFLSRDKQIITVLNKIYDMISYEDEYSISRCIIVEDCINSL
tara:strand:+ start:2310 stop:3011 length:702 start_codon:yes stop_codon:yes gene_type:complete